MSKISTSTLLNMVDQCLFHLLEWCDSDPRNPYFDIKKHKVRRNGSCNSKKPSYYLTLRLQSPGHGVTAPNKKFFAESRAKCIVKAYEFLVNGGTI